VSASPPWKLAGDVGADVTVAGWPEPTVDAVVSHRRIGRAARVSIGFTTPADPQ
jgi:hypothetical protein